ncbi:MAG: DNA topoisomerase I, partial [Paramuribaculum sp.]|nr:DNA topoisomerase I [Paramuribaculum sp.]
RPKYINKHTIDGTAQEKRRYNLIWKRAVASQMATADIEKTTVEILPSERMEHLTAVGEVVRFDGFLRIYDEATSADESQQEMAQAQLRDGILPAMNEGDTVQTASMTATERFTQHPPRYTEATLVKKMEELGIGRPSTYAPTISTIQNREYIDKREIQGTRLPATTLTLADGKITSHTQEVNVGADKGKLVPTDIGMVVNEFLTDQFPNVLDFNFTADMEKNLDLVAEGKAGWQQEIKGFYEVFHPEVERAAEMHLEHKVGERELGVDPATGRPVSVKIGRFGPVVQIGDSGADEKPQFASLQAGQSVFDITLEQALKLFELPRTVGSFEDTDIVAAIGRFGPYLRHKGKFVSIPKTLSPTGITLEEAVELIEEKRRQEASKTIKTFDAEPDLMVLNGRYGPYISYKKSNYKLPKAVIDKASELTLEQCMEIIKEQDAKPAKPARGSRKKS